MGEKPGMWQAALAGMQKGMSKLQLENKQLKETISNLENDSETGQLKSSIGKYQQDISQLKKENAQLKLESRNNTMVPSPADKILIVELRESVAKLKMENSNLKAETRPASGRNESIRKMSEKLSALESENEVLQERLKRQSNGGNDPLSSSFQYTIDKLQAENKQLARENELLVGKFRQTESTRVATMNENEIMKGELTKLQEGLRKAEDERDKLRKMLQDVTRMTTMKADDKDDEINRLRDKVDALDAVVIKSTNDIKDRTQKLERLQALIDEIRSDLQVSEREKEVLRKEMKDREDRVESLRKDVQRVIQEKEDIIRGMDGDKQKEAKTLDRLMNQIEQLSSGKEAIKKKMEEAEVKVTELDSRLNIEREQLARAEQERENLRRERAELQKKNARLEDDVTERRLDVEKLTGENETMRSENTKLTARVSSLKKENNKLNAETDDLQDEVAVMKNNKAELDKVREHAAHCDGENRELRSKVADLTTKLESAEDAMKMYKDSSKEKAKQLAKIKDQFSGSGAELNKLKVKHELLMHKHEQVEEENKNLINMANEKSRHNAEFMSEISKLKLQNLMLMKEVHANENKKPMYFSDIDESSDRDVKQLKDEVSKLKAENKRLRATLTMKEMTEANCISEITDLQDQLNKKSDQLRHSENKYNKQQRWVDDVIYDKAKDSPKVEKVSSLSLPNIYRDSNQATSPAPARSVASDSKLGPRSRMQGGYSRRK